MTNEQIITQHIQSLEIQNRGYRKQLKSEKSELLCRELTRLITANEVIIGAIAKVADWSFRHGWNERARMTGINKKGLDNQYYESIRIMLGNKLYEKAFDNKYLGIVYDNIKNK